MSQNTISKYACELEDRQLISTENVIKDDLERNGNPLCPICPPQFALDQFHEQQLEWMDTAIERQRVAKAITLCGDKERPVWRFVCRCVALLDECGGNNTTPSVSAPVSKLCGRCAASNDSWTTENPQVNWAVENDAG